MSDFRKLTVWQKAHRLTLDVYRATAAFPQTELYGLTSQMRRCCVSTGSNIAEGCGRSSEIDKALFLGIAKGSASELEYHFLLGHDLGFLSDAEYKHLDGAVTEVKKMLAWLVHKVEAERLAV